MDFPDLGAAVGPPKRDKIPPRNKALSGQLQAGAWRARLQTAISYSVKPAAVRKQTPAAPAALGSLLAPSPSHMPASLPRTRAAVPACVLCWCVCQLYAVTNLLLALQCHLWISSKVTAFVVSFMPFALEQSRL